jgi:hypothetical protein
LIAGGRLQTTREFENEASSPQIPPGAPSDPMESWPAFMLASLGFKSDDIFLNVWFEVSGEGSCGPSDPHGHRSRFRLWNMVNKTFHLISYAIRGGDLANAD